MTWDFCAMLYNLLNEDWCQLEPLGTAVCHMPLPQTAMPLAFRRVISFYQANQP
jgi:hypothetical protein